MITQCSPEEAQQAVDVRRALILDVREPGEWAQARIPGAMHVPLQQIPDRIAELPRDRLIICQCASGGRSLSATQYLDQAGFEAVNMVGGIMQWARCGLPVVR